MTARPQASHDDVLAANIAEHAAIAVEYRKRTRELATTPALWKGWYADHLRLAIRELRAGDPECEIRALDALGGSGKTALFLQQQGLEVVVVDVSVEMTDVYREIAAELGLPANVVVADIQDYVASPKTPSFALITASSALHHVADYTALLQRFYEKLKPGGFLHTAWDPLPRTGTVRALAKVEYYVSRARQPAATWRGLRRRIARRRRLADSPGGVDHEYHKSIDDEALVRAAREMGFLVRDHRRNAGGVLKLTKPLWERASAYTTFALLLQKPG